MVERSDFFSLSIQDRMMNKRYMEQASLGISATAELLLQAPFYVSSRDPAMAARRVLITCAVQL